MGTTVILLAVGASFLIGFFVGNYYVFAILQELQEERLSARREQFIKEQTSTIDEELKNSWEW